MDLEDYESSIKLIKSLDINRNRAIGSKLMSETRSMRREWIARDNPNVIEVLGRFPLLKDTQIVSSKTIIIIFLKKSNNNNNTNNNNNNNKIIIINHHCQFQAECWNFVDRNREDAFAAWNAWKSTIIKVAELEAKRTLIKRVLQNYKQIPEGLSQETGKKLIEYSIRVCLTNWSFHRLQRFHGL